jgi:hypothetical protein
MHPLIWLCILVTRHTFRFDIVKNVHTHVQFGEVPVFVALISAFVYILLS